MIKYNKQNIGYTSHLNLEKDNNFENDDLITFQLDSKEINLFYSQLTKYSKNIRDEYLFSDVINRLPHEIQQFQNQYEISSDNIFLFFQLLHQNYNIDENLTLTYIQCIDLIKISQKFEIRKLMYQINEYIKSKNVDVEFIIQMIQYEMKKLYETEENKLEISSEIEAILTDKIDECFSNEKFAELPISIIYRVIEGSLNKGATSDKIFDFIKNRMKQFYLLFQFVELSKLSENRLEEIYELYSRSEEKDRIFFNYIKCDMNIVEKMILNKKKHEEEMKFSEMKNDESEAKIIQLQNKNDESEATIIQLQNKNDESENKIIQLKKKNDESEAKIIQLQNKNDESKRISKEQQEQLDELKSQIKQLKKQLSTSEASMNQIRDEMQQKIKQTEKERNELQRRLEEENNYIKGDIVTSVKNGLLINARISLIIKDSSLDTKRSKYIISSDNSKEIEYVLYEKGEQITSLEMNTIDFLCKPGTYCIRCIVFDISGRCKEIVSNTVTMIGKSITFEYERQPAKFSLMKGQYKLEVWGAQGGDSEGTRKNSTSKAKGGLGGYSTGVLNLKENEIVYVYVGGEGRPADSSDGITTSGGFPDGGGTKTGHHIDNYTSVPGTGGGSTSIRIKEDSDYSRVIVAGGGGGASGSNHRTNNGGFGGGQSGGNCEYRGSLQSTGSGTQTGSSGCYGGQSNGEQGVFGHGASGRYDSNMDSGGGGGGGWYGGGGGGSGGCGGPSSGGGGSGWIFTASSFNTWQSGDSSEASKFILDSSFQLSEALTSRGDEEFPCKDGNGKERGHRGNGCAKITPI